MNEPTLFEKVKGVLSTYYGEQIWGEAVAEKVIWLCREDEEIQSDTDLVA